VIVLGRAPDPQAAQLGAELAGRKVEAVSLGGTFVSANHAAVWSDGEGICVRDIGSKNRTWLSLEKYQTARVDGPAVALQLAQTGAHEGASDEPTSPKWRSAGDYAAAVTQSIQQWLERNGVDVRIHLVAEPRSDDAPPWRLPLATGQALDIEPLGTLDARSARLLEELLPWTGKLNSHYENEEETRREGLILASCAFRTTHREVVDASKGGARALLLTGPPGAGKEVLADVFHRHSGRNGPLVSVNCAEFQKGLLRAELFGAEKGSFTGCTRTIVGAVERAQGGTLFLDEIGELDGEVQPMLLRFLDRHEFQRMGQMGRAQQADVRVVAATNRDLREETRSGRFRADLWWRLSVYVFEVPPLRERWDDIVAYLDTVRTEDGGSTLRAALAPAAVELLQAHHWEGNFRELRSFAERLSHGGYKRPIDAASCRRVLERSSITSVSPMAAPLESAPADWSALVSRAVAAFKEDREHEPRSWDDQKAWSEEYLKPLLFYFMSGAAGYPPPLPGDGEALTTLANKCAARVNADRGTALRQLARYFERFRS
jgi:DNA-binding NtrC family response regulator